MKLSQFNFKKEVIVLALLWIICAVLVYNVFPASPYQGQSVMIFYANVISSSFFPALFFFFIYLAIVSLIEILMGTARKQANWGNGQEQ